MTDTDRDFVPALGKSGSLDRYDAAIALMTREKRWRSDLLKLLAPQPGDRIVDIGCGTGTLAIALKEGEPESEILAVDPDPAVLEIARTKARTAGADIHWFEAMGDALGWDRRASGMRQDRLKPRVSSMSDGDQASHSRADASPA